MINIKLIETPLLPNYKIIINFNQTHVDKTCLFNVVRIKALNQ